MSEGDDLEDQIIIRRRRHDDEEEHHGGVWKLAFADFMTAMMAFFLVMWLINSTSKETKASIVQYFNPVQLIDANPAHKGLRDPKEQSQGKSLQRTDQQSGDSPKKETPDEHAQAVETALHQEPLKALDKIAQREAPLDDARGARTAPRFQDPFDRAIDAAAPIEPDKSTAETLPKNKTRAEQALQDARSASDKAQRGDAQAVALQAELKDIVGKEQNALRGSPHVEVSQTEEGLLISLTDDADFSMFAVGSIEPKPQLVRILGKIGALVAKQTGAIEIRGHTDGRTYRNVSYDNWRLSSDRATMVNYMLVRGGLPEGRVTNVSGYADHRLKLASDPFAAINRRIEILVKGER
jgi:chemotaxis protein MotB